MKGVVVHWYVHDAAIVFSVQSTPLQHHEQLQLLVKSANVSAILALTLRTLIFVH